MIIFFVATRHMLLNLNFLLIYPGNWQKLQWRLGLVWLRHAFDTIAYGYTFCFNRIWTH